MEELAELVKVISLTFVLIALVFVPGFLSLKALRFRTGIALAVAPAWTFAIIGTSATITPLLPWGWGIFGLSTLVSLIICLLVGRRYPAMTESSPPAPYFHVDSMRLKLVLATVIVVLLCLIVPILYFGSLEVPSSLADPMYHYNGVRNIKMTGSATMFGAMDPNYGIRVLPIVYPSSWHATVSLVSNTANIIAVSHLLAYVIIPTIWVIGIAFLAMVAFPRIPAAGIIAPIASLLFPVFPQFLAISKGFWPNALGLALVPGILSVAVLTYHRARWEPRPSRLRIVILGIGIFLFTVFGASLVHPSVLFSIIFLLSPGVFAFGVWLVRQGIKKFGFKRVMLPTLVVAILAILFVISVFSVDRVSNYLARTGEQDWNDFWRRIGSLFVLWPLGENPLINVPLAIGMATLILVGIGSVLRRPHTSWIAYGWFVQSLLILGSYFPLGPLTAISGLWYLDTYRLFAVQSLFSILLVTATFVTATNLMGKHVNRFRTLSEGSRVEKRPITTLVVGTVTSMALIGITSVLRAPTIYFDVKPQMSEDGIISSTDELDLLRDLGGLLPDDALVIGDPFSGIGYAPVLADVDSVYVQRNMRSLDHDGNFLAMNFNQISTDPTVCEILTHYNIEYFYEDAPVTTDLGSRREKMPGFYHVDKSEGFTLIASAGQASLWKIDECDDFEEFDWWDTNKRRSSLLPKEPMPSRASGHQTLKVL